VTVWNEASLFRAVDQHAMRIGGGVGVEADDLAAVVNTVQHRSHYPAGIVDVSRFATDRVVDYAMGKAVRADIESDSDAAIVDAQKLRYRAVLGGKSDQ
jgi:hypothetical protein